MSSDADLPQPLPAPEVVPPAPPPPRFDAEPYRPDGGVPSAGLALVLAGVLGTGVAVGCAASLIGQWLYLIIIFPALMGLGVGAVGVALVKAGRIRHPALAALAGVLGGVMALGGMHYFDSLRYAREVDRLVQELVRNAPEKGPGGERPVFRAKVSLLDFMHAQAKQGVSIGKPGQKDGINLGYTGSIIYWLVEVLFAAGVAAGMMRAAAAAPFCRECGVWKDEKPLAMVAPGTAGANATDAIRDGELARLLESSGPPAAEGLLLKLAACPNCGAEGDVVVTLCELSKNDKGATVSKDLARATYPGAVLRSMGSSGG
jgi:hypothetical protein